jgi:hypothetical protein
MSSMPNSRRVSIFWVFGSTPTFSLNLSVVCVGVALASSFIIVFCTILRVVSTGWLISPSQFFFAACSSSSILLCASMKQSLWFGCCGNSGAFVDSFLFCSNDVLLFFCSLRIFDGDDGVALVSATRGVFLRVGCTDFSGQHAFHSFSSQSIQFSHFSIISSSVV